MAAVFDKTSDPMSSINMIKRAILVSEIPYLTDNADDLKDKLIIYFGKTKNGGGSIEQVLTPFGGSLSKALIVFETSSVATTVLNRRHSLEGSILKIQELPPVFAEMQGSIEIFYSDALAKRTSENIVAHLSSQFGSGKAEWKKQTLTSVTGHIDFLQEVKGMIYVALFKIKSSCSVDDIDRLVDKSVKITDIPYVTDDIEQLREELGVFLRDKNHMDPEKIILPIGGSMRKAVVIFRNCAERNQFLSRTPRIMFNERMIVEKLPQVFTTITASVDQFYPKTSSKAKWDKVTDIIQLRFKAKFTKQEIEISGRLDEVIEVAALIRDAAGIPESDTFGKKEGTFVADDSQNRNMNQAEKRSELPAARSKETKTTSGRKPSKSKTNAAAAENDPHCHQHSDRTLASHPTASSNDVDIRRSSVNIVDDHYGHPSSAKGPSDIGLSESKMYGQSVETDEAGGKTQPTDTRASSDDTTKKKSLRSTSSTGSKNPENTFMTIDALMFNYIEDRFKKEIKDLEKMYNVKIKPRQDNQSDSDLLCLEAQPKTKSSKSVKRPDIDAAKEEFNKLVEDSNIKKEVLAFKNLSKKEVKKVEDRLKIYPNMKIRWDDSGCSLCGEDVVVDAAAEELRNALFGYESMTVDKLGFEYLSHVHKDLLDDLKMKYNITMDVQMSATDKFQQTVYVKPIKKKKCSLEDLGKAKDEFITLYQRIYLSTKKTAVKCQGTSEDEINESVRLTKTKYPKIYTTRGTAAEEIIICTDESIHDSAVREFRNLVGLAPKRKLKKTPSGDKKETTLNLRMENTSYIREDTLPTEFVTREGLTIKVITDDLVKQTSDVIVNTANTTLSFDGGVSKAISTAAGPELQKECKALLRGRFLPVGECLPSDSFDLSCERVIHVVGPRYMNEEKVFGKDLKRTISNVLSLNEMELCFKSIALPLISSGNLGGPKKYCAKVHAKALEDFSTDTLHSGRHLKEVVLVNNEAETTKIIQEVFAEIFEARHHLKPDLTANNNRGRPPKALDRIHQFKSNRGIDLFIVNDDITCAKVDVIVNAANKRLRHGRGVAGALSKAAGNELQKECDMLMNKRPPLKTGELVVTSGYNLNARILHIVGPIFSEYSSDKEFYQTLKETFTAAIRYANIPIEAKSIAVPLVSSGIYGGPKQTCANALLEAIEEFDNERNIVLEKIVLINLDMDATQALYQAFSQRYTECQCGQDVFDLLTESSTDKQGMKHQSGTGRQSRKRAGESGESEHQGASKQLSYNPDNYKDTVGGDNTQLPRDALADNQSDHGASSESWSIVTDQEISDGQRSQESGYLTEYIFKPLTNLIFGGEPSKSQGIADESNTSSTMPHSSYTQNAKLKSDNTNNKEKASNFKRKCRHPGSNTQLLHCCNQTLCAQCITEEIVHKGKCCICGALYGVVEEQTLGGTMTYYSRSNLTLPGEKSGVIEMLFQFAPGTIQATKRHKARTYKGNDYLAYLPNTNEGRDILYLLRTAFCNGLLFEVSKNDTKSPKVTISGLIELKINFKGGIDNNGYPDPEYIQRVRLALQKNGIVSSMASDV